MRTDKSGQSQVTQKSFGKNRPQDSTLGWEKGDRSEAGGRDSVRGRRRREKASKEQGHMEINAILGSAAGVGECGGWTEHMLPEGMLNGGEREMGT